MSQIEVQTREAEAPVGEGGRALRTSRAVLKSLFGPAAERTFHVRFWDGSIDEAPLDNSPNFTLILRKPGTLRRMLLPPSELALGEAFLRDDFDIDGNAEAATALADKIAGRLRSPLTLARVLVGLRSLPVEEAPAALEHERHAAELRGAEHTKRRDAVAVRYHYDVGNDFYSFWLDKRMVYSCAYFQTGTEDIDTAQAAKLEHICRKLRLQPGERLLDIGCGWGGLVMYAAQHYGVHAVGITLSEPQAELARKRIADAGLSKQCHVEVRDYRSLPHSALFDKVVSVGMFEHVGRSNLPTYFSEAFRLTKPGGLFLNHGIVTLTPEPGNPLARAIDRLWGQGQFIERYVFPDGELVMPAEVLKYAEDAGFETRDVESLREHYALTLRHWVRRLEAHHDEAVEAAGEPTYRVWRLYMSGTAHGFAAGRIGIIQALFARQDEDGNANLPLTRDDLYRD